MVREALFSEIEEANEADRSFHQGLEALGESKRGLAVIYFDEAFAKDPKLYEAAMQAVRTQLTNGRWSDVIHRCDRLIPVAPPEPRLQARLLYCRGVAKADSGKLDEGLADFDEALKRMGDDPALLFDRAAVSVKLGRPETDVLKYWRKCYRI